MNLTMKHQRILKRAIWIVPVLSLLLVAFTLPEGGPSAGGKKNPAPDSKYNGVQIGVITYSFRSIRGIEETLQACVDAGISSVELMGTGVEAYLGAPANPLSWREMRRPENLSDEKKKAFETYQKEIREWRYADGTLEKYKKLRKMFNDAGVDIHIYKWTAGMNEEDLDYSFEVARTLGAIGITAEIGEENCKRIGAAAERAGMLAIFHNHYQYAEEGFDVDYLLSLNPANRLNFDVGHYYGSTGKNPADFIRKYHDQIASIHLKDKTGPDNETEKNENQVWGQGEVPLKEVLLLIKENQWPIHCDIELEYEVKPWSNPVREVSLCREFSRQILL